MNIYCTQASCTADCDGHCVYDFGGVRKVKPYPEVPPDLYAVQAEFDSLMTKLGWAVAVFLVVICGNLLFAGYILWSML